MIPVTAPTSVRDIPAATRELLRAVADKNINWLRFLPSVADVCPVVTGRGFWRRRHTLAISHARSSKITNIPMPRLGSRRIVRQLAGKRTALNQTASAPGPNFAPSRGPPGRTTRFGPIRRLVPVRRMSRSVRLRTYPRWANFSIDISLHLSSDRHVFRPPVP
jgi:hypothetical protein